MKPHRHVIRRRALFPADENSSDSGLGCISPLDFDDEVLSLNVGDYDIIGLVDKSPSTPQSDAPCSSATPHHLIKDSPTQKLKTPHDTSTNCTLPKLTRKSDTTFLAPLQDSDKSKVRTALFPDMSVPPKTFYSTPKISTPRSHFGVSEKAERKPGRKRKLYLCNRQRKVYGQINAGVSHKIKKVKRKFRKIKEVIENNLVDTVPSESTKSFPEEPVLPEPEPELDPNKKFFKFSKPKGVVTVNPNIKLEVNNGKISLMNGQKRPKGHGGTCQKKIKLSTDFDVDEPLVSPSTISSVISSLEDNKENASKQDILMSPTSQMCNMTSGLALNSPKKMKNLNPILESMSSEQKKLFPIFYQGKTSVPPNKTEKPKNSAKKFKALAKDQMLLDAGQKRFGVTQCSECQIIYHMGDPGDEIMHQNYHNATHIFKFNGWKNERVVFANSAEGRIIQILPTDSKIWWKKVQDVMEVVNRDLGFYDIKFNTSNSQIFFYIKNKTIVGALVAEAKTTAHKLLTSQQNEVDLCSEKSYTIKCGVSRIWVSQNHRKKGIATALMDSLKRNFMFGCVLTNEEIAFSTPTEMGKMFGKNYFKTPNFLIYFV